MNPASTPRPRAPQLLGLKPAVRQIVAALHDQPAAEFPFFLIVGAGISAPAVPLADELVARCQQRCREQGLLPEELPPDSLDPLERYAAWFKAAYPQREDRQRVFAALIERAPLSPAVMRLAHLLLQDAQPRDPIQGDGRRQRPLSNVVVTPNFDDLLSRALRLFGADTVVCDHPRVTGRITPERRDVLQLVHVHGSFRHYDGCNLRQEIEERAQPDDDQASEGMLGLLGALLRERSPLVIGYAGWERDVIMTALRQRLQRSSALPRNVYWFCYRRAEVERLPGWLTGHADVRCVVPEDAPFAAGDAGAAARSADEALDPPGTLSAARVFVALIQALGLDPPRLTGDPLGFFADHLEKLLPADDKVAGRDIYTIHGVIQRVRRAVELERQEREAQPQQKRAASEGLTRTLDAVRRADFATAIESAQGIALDQLDDAQCGELDGALQQAYEALGGRDVALDACNLRVSVAERALKRRGGLAWQVRHARALHGVGYCHDVADRHDEALEAYERMLNLYGHSPEPELQERAARSLVGKGATLARLGRSEDAIAVYDEVERRFGTAADPALREQVAKGLVGKGLSLGTLGRSEDAVAVYDEVERRFGSASEPVSREAVARALVNKGAALRRSGRSEDAVAVYDDVERRFGSASEPVSREAVARALVNKGATLGTLGRSEGAIAVYDEVERRFGTASEPGVREAVEAARANRAHLQKP